MYELQQSIRVYNHSKRCTNYNSLSECTIRGRDGPKAVYQSVQSEQQTESVGNPMSLTFNVELAPDWLMVDWLIVFFFFFFLKLLNNHNFILVFISWLLVWYVLTWCWLLPICAIPSFLVSHTSQLFFLYNFDEWYGNTLLMKTPINFDEWSGKPNLPLTNFSFYEWSGNT